MRYHDQYQLVTTEKALARWVEAIQSDPSAPFAFDSETTSKDPMAAKLVGISLAVADGAACYVPIAHHTTRRQIKLETALELLYPVLTKKKYTKVLHNAVYDMLVMSQYDVPLVNVEDTMMMAYTLEARHKNYGVGMDELAMRHMKYRTIEFDEVFKPVLGMETFADIGLRPATAYAAEDTDVTLRLFSVLRAKLEKAGLWHVYNEIDRPLLEPLTEMAWNGAKVNVKRLRQLSSEWGERKEEAKQAAFRCVDGEFNLGSPAELRALLFDRLGLPILSYTDSGLPSTDSDTLKLLANEHEVAKHISEYRMLDKLIGTYALALPLKVNPSTGRVHTFINATGTRTGRFSSSAPNLQNVPTRTKEGEEIRRCFVAPKGRKIVSVDYSQIELRVLAHDSQDRTLVKAFHNGEDIHAATAVAVFGLGKYDKDNEAHSKARRAAKTVNFGLIYGQTEFGLSKGLGISVDEAAEFIATYFKKLPGVRDYIEEKRAEAKATGYVETLFGRRLYVDAIHSSDPGMRAYGERQSVNYIIQGSAADLMRLAMPAVYECLRTTSDALLMLTVHDELLAEASDEEASTVAKVMRAAMETCADGRINWRVPILAEAQIGQNWKEAH